MDILSCNFSKWILTACCNGSEDALREQMEEATEEAIVKGFELRVETENFSLRVCSLIG